jgi:ureidoglycolate hydrolase
LPFFPIYSIIFENFTRKKEAFSTLSKRMHVVDNTRIIKTLDLDEKLFSPYGKVLTPGEKEKPEVSEAGIFDFYVPFSDSSQGWQIGYLVNAAKRLEKLERHPNTPEVFSPLHGNSVLVVTEDPGDSDTIFGFFLSKPIVFDRGIWHGVISTTKTSEILIVESPDVIDEFFQLPFSVTV